MKKFIVISALLASLIGCDKEEKTPATEVAADATDVTQDVSAVDTSVEVSADVSPVEAPDTSSSTDASVGG